MKAITRKRLARRKQRIACRLREIHWAEQRRPMLTARNVRYEVADRTRGLAAGGIGAMHLLALRTGLVAAIDRQMHVLKRHLPYHESDHVLNTAYNLLSGGTCLEDIERLRTDEAYLDALGARRVPDPTTAGDFCRRFAPADIERLMDAINAVRLGVWKLQPPAFFAEAVVDADGTLATTCGECKEGMDISFKGQWGYHPLVVSLANTAEPLYLVNRSGNRPSHEGAAAYLDRAIALCRRAYRAVVLRKNLSVEKGERRLFDDVRYFFYLTNDRTTAAAEIVPAANGRCNQENLIEQLKNGARAMEMPVGDLVSNWAYMVMASLAPALKAWLALVLPEGGRWRRKHAAEKQSVLRMKFKKFLNRLVRVPCQIVRTGRRKSVPALVVEPVAGGVAAGRRRAAPSAAVLTAAP